MVPGSPLRRFLFLMGWLAAAAATAPLAASGARSSVKAEPFNVLVLTGINALTNNYPEFVQGATAAAQAINKQGGFGGRPVQVTACNMQGSAAGEAACAQQAADQKVDWVLNFNSSEPSGYPILKNAGIPYAGSRLYTPSLARDPQLYPQMPAVSAAVAAPCFAAVKAAQAKGDKHPRFAFFVLDNAAATGTMFLCRQAVIKAGGSWVGVVPIQTGGTD